jgi:hypothetical protein
VVEYWCPGVFNFRRNVRFFFFDSASLRSMFSLVVIWFSHLAVIVRRGYVVPSMVLSQRRVQMR